MSTLYKIIGPWQVRYADTLTLAETIARQMTEEGESVAIYRMSYDIETTPVSIVS